MKNHSSCVDGKSEIRSSMLYLKYVKQCSVGLVQLKFFDLKKRKSRNSVSERKFCIFRGKFDEAGGKEVGVDELG